MIVKSPEKRYIVKIHNLNQYLGNKGLQVRILFDINLAIQPGEIVIMTGPSGSGKTTLLTLIGGLRSVQEGSLKFLGEELYQASNEQLVQVRRRIGYIFQAHNLLDFLTARQNVQMTLELHKNISAADARRQSEAMLNAVKLLSICSFRRTKATSSHRPRLGQSSSINSS